MRWRLPAQFEQPCIVPVHTLPLLQAIFTFIGFSERAALINNPIASEVSEWQSLITRFPPGEITPNLLILLTEAQPL